MCGMMFIVNSIWLFLVAASFTILKIHHQRCLLWVFDCTRCVNDSLKYSFSLLTISSVFLLSPSTKLFKANKVRKLRQKINFAIPFFFSSLHKCFTITQMSLFAVFFFLIAGLELVNVESQTEKKLVGMLASDKLAHYAGNKTISRRSVPFYYAGDIKN